jgi:streptogramin lyase
MRLWACVGALLGVLAALALWPGAGIARKTASGTLRLPRRSISGGVPKLSASAVQEAGKAVLDVTLRSPRSRSLSVARSDFRLSAGGDLFGVESWSAGRSRVTVGPGRSRVFRLTFSAPRAVTHEAALFYRPAQGGESRVVPLSGVRSSASAREATTSAQPVITSFSAAQGVGDTWGTAVDGSGNIWFAEPGCDFQPTCPANSPPGQIGELTPLSGSFTFYTLPDIPGNQPIFLAFDSSGKLWFTTPNNSMIGEFNPSSGRFSGQWPVTAGSGPWDLTFANGQIWYTEHLASAVGTFNPATHVYRDFQTPTADSNPYGIAASGGLIWFTENNSTVDSVASLDTGNGNAIAEYPIVQPPSGGTPHMIVVGANGQPWWTEGFTGTIATLDPAAATPGTCGRASGTCDGIQQFQVPPSTSCGSSTHTSGIAFQSSANVVWLDDSLTSQVGSFNPSNGAFAMNALSDCNAHPHDGLNLDAAGDVWFDEEFANAIGELIPPSVPVPTRPASILPPTVAGSARVGERLTAANGSWTNNPTSYAHQWEGCDSSGNSCGQIAGATGQAYTLTDADAGHTIRVQVIATNGDGASNPATSAPTAVVLPQPPANSAAPRVLGSPRHGRTVKATSGSWTNDPTSLSYQWQRCDRRCADIAGATRDSYTPGAGDVGSGLRVIVTASNAGGSAQAPSSEIGPVGPSRRDVKVALSRVLPAAMRRWTIRKLLKKGGYRVHFGSPSAGTLAISWTVAPRGARLRTNRSARNPRRVLIASARLRFSRAGVGVRLRIRLTRAGKRLLNDAARLRLTAKGTFAPRAEGAVTSSRRFTLG